MRSVAFKYKNLVAVQISEILRGFVWEKVAGWQGLPSSNFFPYKSSFHFKYLNCCQILFSNCTDLKLGSSTYFFLLYSFLVLTKCQVINLRVGRSCDQVLQRAYSSLRNCHPIHSCHIIPYLCLMNWFQ